jgi:hypothetical protein
MLTYDTPATSHDMGYLYEACDTAKKRDIASFKVNGQSYIILQQLSCGTRGKDSFVSRNLTGPKTLPKIWGAYMKLVTKYQISAINSY